MVAPAGQEMVSPFDAKVDFLSRFSDAQTNVDGAWEVRTFCHIFKSDESLTTGPLRSWKLRQPSGLSPFALVRNRDLHLIPPGSGAPDIASIAVQYVVKPQYRSSWKSAILAR